MTQIKEEYPYIEPSGLKNSKMVKFYAEDERGVRYKVRNEQTGKILDEAVCLYPSPYTYVPTAEKCEKQLTIISEKNKKKVWKHEESVSRETVSESDIIESVSDFSDDSIVEGTTEKEQKNEIIEEGDKE